MTEAEIEKAIEILKSKEIKPFTDKNGNEFFLLGHTGLIGIGKIEPAEEEEDDGQG